MLKAMLENVRTVKPLVHNITNYVTVNDCANILLACGASPIMADDPEEAEEVSTLCAGTNINIGTLNQRTIPSMLTAGKTANRLGHPVVLDPVGVGASRLRTETAHRLIRDIKFAVIRGNISEIKTLAVGKGNTQGVDAAMNDRVTEDNIHKVVSFAKNFSKETGAVVAISGAMDIVTDGDKVYCLYNGNPMMGRITGAGCQLSALVAAYVAANPETPFEATIAAFCAMGVCGEIAFERLAPMDGNASYRNYIIDAIYNLDGDTLERRARFKIL